MGVFICIASEIAAIALVFLDRYADKVDGEGAKMINEEDKFKFKDLTKFKFKFWLITLNCVLVYTSIFPY